MTNTSVNPARSTGPAVWVGGWALAQLWLFWVAPIIGATSAGMAYRALGAEDKAMLDRVDTRAAQVARGPARATRWLLGVGVAVRRRPDRR